MKNLQFPYFLSFYMGEIWIASYSSWSVLELLEWLGIGGSTLVQVLWLVQPLVGNKKICTS